MLNIRKPWRRALAPISACAVIVMTAGGASASTDPTDDLNNAPHSALVEETIEFVIPLEWAHARGLAAPLVAEGVLVDATQPTSYCTGSVTFTARYDKLAGVLTTAQSSGVMLNIVTCAEPIDYIVSMGQIRDYGVTTSVVSPGSEQMERRSGSGRWFTVHQDVAVCCDNGLHGFGSQINFKAGFGITTSKGMYVYCAEVDVVQGLEEGHWVKSDCGL